MQQNETQVTLRLVDRAESTKEAPTITYAVLMFASKRNEASAILKWLDEHGLPALAVKVDQQDILEIPCEDKLVNQRFSEGADRARKRGQ